MFSENRENMFMPVQYWPTWAFYSMAQGMGQAQNYQASWVPINSSSQNDEFEKGVESLQPKIGFMECKPKEQSDTTSIDSGNLDYCVNSDNYVDNDLGENESSFTCKKKKPISKKSKQKRGPQNKNRNIIPSVVQQIFSYLSKPTKSKQICTKLFETLPKPQTTEVSIKKYYSFIKEVKQRLDHYVNQKSLNVLCQYHSIGINLFSIQEQSFYLKVSRILSKYFLVNHLPFLAMHSKRMLQDKRVQHLIIKRSLIQILENMRV